MSETQEKKGELVQLASSQLISSQVASGSGQDVSMRGRKVLLDTNDGEQFLLRLLRLERYPGADHSGATYDDLERARNFPQRKWSEYEGGWLIPLTDPNVSHLFASWREDEMQFTDAARVLVDYHLKTKEIADLKLKERLAFLKDGTLKEPEDYHFAADVPPHPHQKIAFTSGRNAEFFALLMEMGTGKTKVMIDIICDRARKARAKDPKAQYRAIIVAPKTVCHNWLLEFAKHTTLDIAVERLKGGSLKRTEALLNLIRDKETPVLVAVINYEGLEVIKDGLKMVPWDLMALDESIWVKNPSAKRSKSARAVGEVAKSRFILTGLPITKNVLDLYGQFDFLKPGSLGYTSYYAYSNHYSERNHWGGVKSWRKDKLPELQERLARFSFIIKRAQCLSLPPKMYQTLEIEMGDEQSVAYDQMLNDMVVDLENLDDKKAKQTAADIVADAIDGLGGDVSASGRFSMASIILVKLLRLAQITSGYVVAADKTLHRFPQNAKMDALRELLEETDDSVKFIIWSRFREDLRLIHEKLNPDFGVVQFHGGVKDAQREIAIEKFKTDSKCRIFAGQPQSGGFGINLVEATHVVYFSNDFSLQNRAQSEDRAHRIGQTKSVMYTDLVVPDSIDSMIVERIKEKKDLADLLTDRKKIVEALKIQLLARRQEK